MNYRGSRGGERFGRNKIIRVRKGSWVIIPSILIALSSTLSLVGPVSRAHAMQPVFENTTADRVVLASQASRSQCGVLTRQGIGPYTMSGTDASSGDPYSYVTNKNYTQAAQFYESGEAPANQQNMQYTTYQNQTYNNRSGVLRLFSSGDISQYSNTCSGHATYGSAFGPEVWTEAFPATQGQALSFNWAAAGGYDDYEAYGYLVKVEASGSGYDYGSSASTTLIAYGRGLTQDWTTSSGTVPSSGYYRFRFVNGTYDATGGKALGASMYIDTTLTVASPNSITFAQPSDIIRGSSNQTFTVSAYATSGEPITFTSGTTSKCTVSASTDSSGVSTATVTVLANQTGTCTISSNSSATSSYVAAATVTQSFSILQGSTAPTTSGGTSISGDIAYGEVLTANDGTWGDGGSAVSATTYQWQSCTSASCTWANISGATSSTYTVGLADVGNTVRVQVTKTNSIGSLTASSPSSITVPAPTLVNVTNLLDDGSAGSLRWAITTANASATINTITFASNNTGTITLTSALPAISDNLTITGAGLTSTIIDGNNLYRPFNISSSKSLTISDMTLKKGQSTNGGLIYNNAGTLSATNMRFTAMTGGAATYNNGGGSVSTYTNATFDHLRYGIHGDYGSTPSALSQTDADYTNRTYIYDSVFSDNYYAVYTQRFTKINNSQFSNNTYGAVLAGLNRQQVTNSVFTSNGTTSATEGAAIYLAAWIPMGWAMGAGNQTVSGNTFNGNKIAIEFDNSWSNGSRTYNGVSANSFATISGNTFGNTSANTNNFSGSGYVESGNTITPVTTTTTASTTTTTTTTTTSTTTTEPELPVIPEPETPTTVTTIEPVTTTTEPVTTTTEPEAIETPTVTTTTEVETVETPASTDNPKDDEPATPVPQPSTEDETPATPEVEVPKETQDAADAAVEDIFDSPISDAKLADAVDDLVADAETPEQLTAVVTALLDQELTDSQFATVIDSVFSEPLSDENFAAAVDAVFEDPTKLSDAQFEDAVTAVFDAPLSDEQFQDAVSAVFEDTTSLSDEQFDAAVQAVFDEPLSTEQFAEALEAVFDEPISDEKFDAIIDAVLDEPLSDEQFEELVNVLESDTVTEEQVAAAVDSVIENGVTEDQATELATSEKVLESIDANQAAEIFDAVEVGELTLEEEAALVAAVTNAPDEVKNAFEETIDIFAEGLDDYVAVGSQVDVGTRRSLIAASTAVSTLTMAGASGAASGGSGGPSSNGGGNGGGGSDNTEGRSKKEEEGEQEAAGEIAGPEEDEKKKPFTRNSIFKYQEK